MTIPKIASYPMPDGNSIEPARSQWQLASDRSALLIHDCQDYFFDFYDRTAEPIPSLERNIARLADACRSLGIPVYYSAQPAEQSLAERGLLQRWWGPGLTQSPQRASFVASLQPVGRDQVITKWRYSAFHRSSLHDQLKAQGRDQLIICGLYAHIGCLMTAGSAFMADIEPVLVADALADFSQHDHLMALDYARRCCANVLTTDALIASLASQIRPTSYAQLHQQLAAAMEIAPEHLDGRQDLFLSGLDSMRLVALLENWQRAGTAVNLADLMADACLNSWWRLLAPSEEYSTTRVAMAV
jgi:bifunctional isochorismate lyase / aryl carrier protein